MLVGFKPDDITIIIDGIETKRNDVIIGIYNKAISRSGGYAGLVGLELLEQNKNDKSILTLK